MTFYTLNPAVVEDCLTRLIEQTIHQTFAGYLCLQQQSAQQDATTELSFRYSEFFDAYFRVRDHGESKPYFVPFNTSTEPSIDDLWYSEDVAARYAPASLRTGTPFTKIVTLDTNSSEVMWSLVDDHWRSARAELCDGDRVPVESLAAYLLRDYALEAEQPSAYTIVQAFAEEFGYEIGGKSFSHLYDTGDSEITEAAFEKHE